MPHARIKDYTGVRVSVMEGGIQPKRGGIQSAHKSHGASWSLASFRLLGLEEAVEPVQGYLHDTACGHGFVGLNLTEVNHLVEFH